MTLTVLYRLAAAEIRVLHPRVKPASAARVPVLPRCDLAVPMPRSSGKESAYW